MKAKATVEDAWLPKKRISKLRQRLKRLEAKADQYNVVPPQLTVFDSESVFWRGEDYYRVLLEFASTSLGDIKHEGCTLRFNGILEVDKSDQQAFSSGNFQTLADAQLEERYLKWCLQKKCLMCDHCGVAVWRKFVSEYLLVGTTQRLYFGTSCDQTVVGELIRLYLKVLDNWFTPSHEGYPQCSLLEHQVELSDQAELSYQIEVEQKALAEPSHLKKLTVLPDGFYTVKTAADYVKGYPGKILTLLENKERYWTGIAKESELKPGQVFRKISFLDADGSTQEEIHFVPCSCPMCLKR